VVVGPSEGLLDDGVVDRSLPAHELITGEGGSSLGELDLRGLLPLVERRAVHAQPPGKSHFRRRVTFLRRQGHQVTYWRWWSLISGVLPIISKVF
jgi:hypothetical protein